MTELKELHDKAIGAAMNAAFAVAEDEAWFLGGGEPTKKARKAWEMKRGAWLHFARENPTAPADALWIKGGALGLHNGERAFADLPALTQLAFETFQRVFNQVSNALDEAEAAERQEQHSLLSANDQAERARMSQLLRSRADLEDTVLEDHDDPLAPSEFARKAQPAGEGG